MHRSSIGQRAAKVNNPKFAIKRLFAYLYPYKIQLGLIVILILISTLASITGPYLMGVAIDRFIIGKDKTGLAHTAILMIVVYLLMWISAAGYGRIMASIAQKAMKALRKDLFEHMQTLSLSFYDRQSAGDLMSRLTNDMVNINQLLSMNLVSFLSSLFTLVGILIAMFTLNVWLALVTLLVIPAMIILVAVLMKRIGPAFRELQANLGQLNGLMEETITGQRVVIAFSQQDKAITDFEVENARTKSSGILANLLASLVMPLTMMLSNLNLIIVVGAGALMAINNFAGVTIGLIATFTEYTRRFGQPLGQISNLFSSIISALAGAERIFNIVDEKAEIQDKANAIAVPSIKGEVIFNNVSFNYKQDEPVLKDISLKANPGETIALVGPTGAGKTTIVNLLTRFYDIDSGTILIDGNNIKDVKVDDLRRQLGIVLQDTYLFSDTVMENIRYGRLDATDEEVISAAKLANAHGFIRRLPHGYQTELSERASNLSQGQRQLLAIARAILADPSILILDEATSSVDTRTEVQIQQALLTLMEGRTSFVIAHRLSTIRGADQILVINEGRIIESGKHADLLAQNGFYANLYTSQFKGKEAAVNS